VSTISSKLFARKYPVIRLKSGQTMLNSNLNACVALGVFGYDTPPLVLIPNAGQTRDQECSFLEHEFVHVNQALLDCYPVADGMFQDDPLDGLLKYAREEHDANYLQLFRWPEIYESGDAEIRSG